MQLNQTKPMFLLRKVQVLHYPVVFLLLEGQIISTGTVSMEDQNLNFLYSPTAVQKMISSLLKIQDSPLAFQKVNMWIWRFPLLLYQTLLCTTVLWRPQWQEIHQLSTKTCYNERRHKKENVRKKLAYKYLSNLLQKGSKLFWNESNYFVFVNLWNVAVLLTSRWQ